MSNTEICGTQTIFEAVGALPSLAMLPSPQTIRWVMRRKAEVVVAVRAGRLSLQDACDRYAISVDEFVGWQSAMERSGLSGLRVTRTGRSQTAACACAQTKD